jgi:hypothetical protein
MELGGNMLNKISLTHKDKYHMFSPIWINYKKCKLKLVEGLVGKPRRLGKGERGENKSVVGRLDIIKALSIHV